MFSRRVAFSTILSAPSWLLAPAMAAAEISLPQNCQVTLPSVDSDLVITANLPARTIGEELPS